MLTLGATTVQAKASSHTEAASEHTPAAAAFTAHAVSVMMHTSMRNLKKAQSLPPLSLCCGCRLGRCRTVAHAPCVVAATLPTLVPHNVEGALGAVAAVVAEHSHLHVLVLLWHGSVSYRVVHVAPHVGLLCVVQDALEAQRAVHAGVLYQVPVTRLVYGVPAGQHRDGPYRVEQVLKAHGAVLVHAVGHAHVAVLQGHAVAAVAGGAVEEVGAAADAADAAVAAVELLLAGVIVEKVALHAAVAAEGDAAGGAGRGDGLPGVAERADDLGHLLAVQLVPLLGVLFIVVLGGVVAVPAPEHLAAARRYQHAPALVVVTAMLHAAT